MAEVQININADGEAILPEVCACCGRPASATRRPMRFAAAFLTDVVVQIPVPLCWRHLSRSRVGAYAAVAVWAAIAVGPPAISTMAYQNAVLLFVLGVGIGIWVGYRVSYVGLSAREVGPRHVVLVGVCDDFARAVSESRLCRNCGYDLTGNASGRCPECGTAIQLDGVAESQRKRTDLN